MVHTHTKRHFGKPRVSVLQVIPFFAPAYGFGGPVKVCLDIASYLRKKNYPVTVITTDANDSGGRITKLKETIHNIPVIRFRNLFPGMTKQWNMFLPIGLWSWAYTNIQSYDIIHLHSFFTYLNIVMTFISKQHNIPYIVHLHESPVPVRERGKYLIKHIYNVLFGKKILKGASKIITLTHHDKEELTRYLPSVHKNITVVPNGIHFSPSSSLDKTAIRKQYRIDINKIVILSLSRLSYLKGVDLLLDAFHELTKLRMDVLLLIAGSDEGMLHKLRERVKTYRIEHHVRFLGTVVGEEKESLYRISDLYALFSRYEPFSITTLEALHYRLGVCLTHAVGVSSIVISKQCGIFISDPNDAKKSAEELLNAIQLRHMYSKNSQKVVQLFQLKDQCIHIERIYREAIGSF
jgi:glycosyltransferase involved in cell wall biosynthesis